MKNQFVPYETAKALKDIEFKEDCIAEYICQELHINGIDKLTFRAEKVSDFIQAPLWQQAEEYLWRKFSCFIFIKHYQEAESGQLRFSYFVYVKNMFLRIDEIILTGDSDSPIIAKHSAITSAIKHLLAGK